MAGRQDIPVAEGSPEPLKVFNHFVTSFKDMFL